MNRWYRRRIRAFFYYLDQYLRLLGNPGTKRRFAVVYGYAKLRVLEKLQPKRQSPVKLLGWQVSHGSLFFLRHLYREIFIERLYARHQPGEASLIIDAGANIGIATLWYRYQYPDARIICFEPDPSTFKLLEANVTGNGLENVELHNVAVSDVAGELEFYFDENLSGGDVAHSVNREFRAALDDEPTVASRKVAAVPLSKYLDPAPDILKVDIEGSEVAALGSSLGQLKHVPLVQMEYHYLPNNTLSQLLDILEQAGHTYRVYLDGPLENKLGRVAMVYSTNQDNLRE